MPVGIPEPGDLLPIGGVRMGAACAGIKQNERHDLVVFSFGERATVAGVFTQSAFRAPPVVLASERLDDARAFVVNSGNANAATGESGFVDARQICDAVARGIGALTGDEVLPFSTGVIGERLPVDAIVAALVEAQQRMSERGWADAATAIMTTDTVPKAVSMEFDVMGSPVRLTGIAKGSGMIKPNMATMLAYMAIDAAVPREVLQPLLQRVADLSFNRVTVDGDTSTNDSFMLVAGGEGALVIESADDPRLPALEAGILQAAQTLAQYIARDGEGASKFVTVNVMGGADEQDCQSVAYAIAESPLVKTALFAGDPNWGRFCMAIGRAHARVDPDRVDLDINGVAIARRGMVADGYDEAEAARAMADDEVVVDVRLGMGDARGWVWTCDFSYDYVRINAEYRT